MLVLTFPDRTSEYGNWNAAIIMTSRNIDPNIEFILFVGINCFGITLIMESVIVSLPAYLYLMGCDLVVVRLIGVCAFSGLGISLVGACAFSMC